MREIIMHRKALHAHARAGAAAEFSGRGSMRRAISGVKSGVAAYSPPSPSRFRAGAARPMQGLRTAF